jgi:hypothetical protein
MRPNDTVFGNGAATISSLKKEEAAKQKKLASALDRIAAIGGRELLEAMKSKPRSRAEVLELASKSDAQILCARGLLIVGWPLHRVKKYRPGLTNV